jgi:hypothetical protein
VSVNVVTVHVDFKFPVTHYTGKWTERSQLPTTDLLTWNNFGSVCDPIGFLAARRWHRRRPVAEYPLRVSRYGKLALPKGGAFGYHGLP